MLVRGLVIWCLLPVIAVGNGAFREAVLIPRVGQQVGHILSTIMLSIGILIAAYIAVPWIRPSSPSQAFAVGVIWVALTLAFEFGFGRYRGRTLSELFADYNLLRGRIWIVVPLGHSPEALLTARCEDCSSSADEPMNTWAGRKGP
jgi:hypothetical protein